MPGLVPEEDIRNVHAVLSAYREGKLQIDLDKVTVWFAGHMVLGPRPREGVWDKIREEQKAWTKEYGKSRPWVEDFVPRRARYAVATFGPSDPSLHHVVRTPSLF